MTGKPTGATPAVPLDRDSAIALRAADRAANLASTDELLAARPLSAETRRAISGFKARGVLRDVPVLGPAARALYRRLRGGAS